MDIEKNKVKIVQFADDTTIFLGGSDKEAINVLEVYGSYSGLKMNKEKSEPVWLGKAKRSKSKLCTNIKLLWGATEFKLLGI